ncbi:MMPL family transporter [Sporosarcina sp. HYO08]|uniref:MMPL family transporter n=1 Tax=Sporosarcina sp. HYO08 TaxID=1759557 RepID=UPI00079A707F|nr:MMPL family transporter [Sporosarcina sp. HYO08]KXH78314.1 hypothetical protein AU377_13030 [Sporosarcina sp. HYO08]
MKRKWWIAVISWLLVTIILSAVAPGAKEFTEANKNAGLPDDAASIIADEQLEQYFPQEGGIPLFAVLFKEEGLTEQEILQIATAIEAVDTEGAVEALPITKLQPEIRQTFWSADKKTFFMPLTASEELEGNDLNAIISSMKEQVAQQVDKSIELSWTGPAAIASDAVELFSRADVVLLLSTVGLILVLLLIIYRSPLLTFIPLVAAAIVYAAVDRLIGLFASAGWFMTDSQALSIMTILLFAVVTDYSLLIFSRYREELKRHQSVDAAMVETMRYVKEPIFYSGSTIVLAVATLFFTVYEPYRNFAPVFAIAAGAMLIAGLTLLPALFALIGRKAFWPVIPKYGEESVEKATVWSKVASTVTTKPLRFFITIMLLLIISSANLLSLGKSYDLIDSFPEDLSSRVGYERLGDAFSKGSLAPGTLLIVSEELLTMDGLQAMIDQVESEPGVEKVTTQGNPLSADGKSAKFSIIFTGNPYDEKAFDTVLTLRDQEKSIVKEAGLTKTELYFAGESAKYADLRDINSRDSWLVMGLMTILITIMLGLQTRSVIAPLLMIGTIVLSYTATLGLSLYLFDVFLGLESIGYRIPLYTFVFLVALGVDYSIMLIARIREEMKMVSFEDAVRNGLERTGGVISSAGIILAATFLVLTTMPINELKHFGFIMALGILIDTFIVRPLLIPAILMLLGKRSFWPTLK